MQANSSNKPKAFKFVEGLALHPLNPKHYAMTVAAFAQFADPGANRFTEILIFVGTFTCEQLSFTPCGALQVNLS